MGMKEKMNEILILTPHSRKQALKLCDNNKDKINQIIT